MTRGTVRGVGAIACAVVVSLLALGPGTPEAVAARAVRGFDGSTITVGSLGLKSQLPGAELGARARIERFNSTREIPGVRIEFTETAEDRADPAVALAEARRLVAQQRVFALVADVSIANPGAYLAQQHVPVFGAALDGTYCSPRPSTKVWSFSPFGCIGGDDPAWVGDPAKIPYQYSREQSGQRHPTVMIVTTDEESGKRTARQAAVAYAGAGFDVLGIRSSLPVPSPSDYTPYVQQVMAADHGRAPDMVLCLTTLDCIGMWRLLEASGFRGVYSTALYSRPLTSVLGGTIVNAVYVNPAEDTAGYRQMKADLEVVQPGAADRIDVGAIAGYTSTDMFIEAVKRVAKRGKSAITPERVQQAAARMTWRMPGVAGPIRYPRSTVYSFPTCRSLLESTGTEWITVAPFACSTKTYPMPK